MPPTDNPAELKQKLEENTRLLKENNELLLRLSRNARLSVWLQVIWYVFLIGLPFAVYFYVLEPYFAALGSSYDTFNAGLQEIPGWKQFYEAVEAYRQAEGS